MASKSVGGAEPRRVMRVGNSLGVTIPYRVARELRLAEGDMVLVRFRAVEVAEAPPDIATQRRQALLTKLTPALALLAQKDG